MKKILVICLSVFLLVGCSLNKNTPTKKVEELFKKYQNLDNAVLDDLELVVEGTTLTTDYQKTTYTNIMKMQYSDLKYTIEDETVNGDEATVKAKITVYDFYKTQKDAESYKSTHESEFLTNDSYDNDKFMDYKLKSMQNTTDRVEYTIEINLTKEDGSWKVSPLDKTTLEKIHGTYNYEQE